MQLGRRFDDDFDLARMRRPRQHVLAQHRRHRRDIDGRSLDGRVVGLEARQLEQVFDDARHAIGLAAHLGDRARSARPAPGRR